MIHYIVSLLSMRDGVWGDIRDLESEIERKA